VTDNSQHLRAAAQRRQEDTRARAVETARLLAARGHHVSLRAFCHAAGVSRSWLYTQPDLLDAVQRQRPTHPRPATAHQPTPASDPSLRQRLQAALDKNRQLSHEIRDLRTQLAIARGLERAVRRQS
jgi:Family of unknown function (DUF6262)